MKFKKRSQYDFDPNRLEPAAMQDGSAAGLGESLFDPETSSLLLGALKDEGIEHSQVRSNSSTIPRNGEL